MKQTKLQIILFAMALMAIASCVRDEPIGFQDAMKWKTDVPMKNRGVEVSAEGGTYKFECTNYEEVWLSYVRANGEYIYTENEEYYTIIGEWFDVHAERSVLEGVISPNNDSYIRELKVSVREGNAFYTFWFDQDGINE